MTTFTHHTTLSGIADALRALADQVDSVPDRVITDTWLSVDLQAVQGGGELTDRRATVDALAALLDLGMPTDSVNYSARRANRAGLTAAAYTANDATWNETDQVYEAPDGRRV